MRKDSLKGSENIVQQDDRRARVDCPRQGDTRLLSATEGKTLLTNFRLVARIEESQVALQSTLPDDLLVTILIVLGAEENVVLNTLTTLAFNYKQRVTLMVALSTQDSCAA